MLIKPEQSQMYINNIIYLVENKEKLENAIILEGYLRSHAETCEMSETLCPCKKMIPNKFSELESDNNNNNNYNKNINNSNNQI